MGVAIALFGWNGNCPAQVASQAPSPQQAIPVRLGWYEIPNSALAPLCPNIPEIQGVEGCRAIIDDWGSALADTKRNRFVLWGGGHNGYFGNELYALDLNSLKTQRLTEPSSGAALSDLTACPEAYNDGKPNARHAYNGLQYLSKQDLYFAWGAGLSPCGNFTNVPWVWDPTALAWTRKTPAKHPNPAQNGSIPLTAYDSSTGHIYEVEANTGTFWKYDATFDNWTGLGNVSACGRLNLTSAIDPQAGFYFCIGNGLFDRISLRGSPKVTHLNGAGCAELISVAGPGFDFDSAQNLMVGWAGNNAVYVYDPATDACTKQTFPGGPGPQQPNGTFGRFRYLPGMGIFVLVNDWKQNAFALRLTLALPGVPRHP